MATITGAVKSVSQRQNGNGSGPRMPDVIFDKPVETVARFKEKYGIAQSTIQANLNRCKWCPVNKSCDFSFVRPEWQPLWAMYRTHKYKPREAVKHAIEDREYTGSHSANEVLVVCSGGAKVHLMSRKGSETLRRVAKPGNMLMDVDFFAGGKDNRKWGEGPIVENIESTTESEIAHIMGDIYATLVVNNFSLWRRKLTQMARAVVFGSRDMHVEKNLTAPQKLARTLKMLKDDKNMVNVGTTELAQRAGISVETACRILNMLKSRDYIVKEAFVKRIKLTDEFFKSSLYSSIENA